MVKSVSKELTALSKSDCFLVFSRSKSEFTHPIHTHNVFELNFIENAKGAQRIVGDSIETIDDLELTLIAGNNLEHAWLNHECKSKEIKEITIQFQPDLLDSGLLIRNQFKTIQNLFAKAAKGVTFSRKTIEKIKPRLIELSKKNKGIYSVMELIAILHELSVSENIRTLSNNSTSLQLKTRDKTRIEFIYNFMYENYSKEIRLADLAELIGMSEVAFCRFFKQKTGINFVDALNNIRLSQTIELLINSSHSIYDISCMVGFTNLSNFNRIFLRKKGCTPRQFKENYWKNRIVV